MYALDKIICFQVMGETEKNISFSSRSIGTILIMLNLILKQNKLLFLEHHNI